MIPETKAKFMSRIVIFSFLIISSFILCQTQNAYPLASSFEVDDIYIENTRDSQNQSYLFTDPGSSVNSPLSRNPHWIQFLGAQDTLTNGNTRGLFEMGKSAYNPGPQRAEVNFSIGPTTLSPERSGVGNIDSGKFIMSFLNPSTAIEGSERFMMELSSDGANTDLGRLTYSNTPAGLQVRLFSEPNGSGAVATSNFNIFSSNVIVGIAMSWTTAGVLTAFWSNAPNDGGGNLITDLGNATWKASTDSSNWTLTGTTNIANNGPNGFYRPTIAVAFNPEPSSMMLLLSFLGGGLAYRRKRVLRKA